MMELEFKLLSHSKNFLMQSLMLAQTRSLQLESVSSYTLSRCSCVKGHCSLEPFIEQSGGQNRLYSDDLTQTPNLRDSSIGDDPTQSFSKHLGDQMSKSNQKVIFFIENTISAPCLAARILDFLKLLAENVLK